MPDLVAVPVNVHTPRPTTANQSLMRKNIEMMMMRTMLTMIIMADDGCPPQANEIGRTQVPLTQQDKETTSTEPSDVNMISQEDNGPQSSGARAPELWCPHLFF